MWLMLQQPEPVDYVVATGETSDDLLASGWEVHGLVRAPTT
jgi:hypothetical protein